MDLEKFVEDVQAVTDLRPVVEDIKQAMDELKVMTEATDRRTSSLHIGTGPRFEAKIYFDPDDPVGTSQAIKTAVDMLAMGQAEIEAAEAKLKERGD